MSRCPDDKMLARIAALLRQAEDTDFVANTVRRGRADVDTAARWCDPKPSHGPSAVARRRDPGGSDRDFSVVTPPRSMANYAALLSIMAFEGWGKTVVGQKDLTAAQMRETWTASGRRD